VHFWPWHTTDDNDDGQHKHHTGPQEIDAAIDKEVQEANPDNAEAKDPDLVFSLKPVLKMGNKLDQILKAGKFCNKKVVPEEDDDDDDNDDPIEEDLAKDPTADWSSDKEEQEDEEEDKEVDVTKVNETAVLELLNWESEIHHSIKSFETEVHPHGYKWWRYRYEYTVVESIVLAFSVLVLYFTMWLLHGVSFFQVHKFYKIGLPQRLYRYAYVYFVFHAAALMLMVTIAYMLYVPWGKQNIFNMFAEAFHDWVDGRANVPFLGYSWLYMVLDVQFQLFATFALYSLFMVMVINNYVTALREWKSLSHEEDMPVGNSINVALYRHLDGIVKRRIRDTPSLQQLFKEHKLRLPGVEGLHEPVPGTHEFKLHLFLTEGLGKSIEYLVEVSLTTNLFLALSALVVALLAHRYQVAFMYFLPGFVAVGFVLFVCGYAVSKYYRMLSDDPKHKTESKYVTVHTYCRAVQVLMYCLFFSFSRLLLSNDIFEYYAVIYISALVGLVVILLLLGLFAGEVIKETACALILPPHVHEREIKKYLEHIVGWHNSDKCHQCGAEQFPSHASLSKEWAGKKPMGDRTHPLTESVTSSRPYSWRG